MNRFQLCAPAKAGAATAAAVGLVTWALVTWVPAFRAGLPKPVADVLPFALGWAGHVLAAWISRHPAAPGTPAVPPPAGPGTAPVTRPVPVISPGRVTGDSQPPGAA